MFGWSGVFRRHPRSPALARKPAGQDPQRAVGVLRGRTSDALFPAEVQSFLDYLMAGFSQETTVIYMTVRLSRWVTSESLDEVSVGGATGTPCSRYQARQGLQVTASGATSVRPAQRVDQGSPYRQRERECRFRFMRENNPDLRKFLLPLKLFGPGSRKYQHAGQKSR